MLLFSSKKLERPPVGEDVVTGAPLYPGYIPIRTCKAFLQREGSGGWDREYIEADGIPGLRWHSPLFLVDGFYSDAMPQRFETRPARMAVWQPYTRTEKTIPGWYRSVARLGQRLHGITSLLKLGPYWQHWDAHAQRHRRQWLKQEGLVIQEESMQDFLEAYLCAPTKFSQDIFLKMLHGRARCHGRYLRSWVMRDVKTGQAIAGLVALDAPEAKISLHVAAFTHPDGFHRSAGIGMIDYWFQDALEQGFYFLDFDLFWNPGDPVAWQGFSRFKGQFDIHYIRYPQPFSNYFLLGRQW